MHYRVFNGLFIVITSHLFLPVNAAEIDGKLDFGGSHSLLRSTHTPRKFSKSIQAPTENFEDIGVVCTSSGCNTTKTSSNRTGDVVQTDVLVHIQTKIDFDQSNKAVPVEDTPDVPIVVGYAGSQLDATHDDDTSHSLKPQTIFVPEVPTTLTSHSFGGSFNLDSSGNPSTFFVSNNNPSQSPGVVSRVNTFGGSFDGVRPGGFFVTKSTPLGPRVDAINRSFEKLDPEAKSGYYPPKSDPDDQENRVEIKIPFFDTTYHNHHYGENPPQQYVWYSKKTNTLNPVEFKTVKATWTPSTWNRKVVSHSYGSGTGPGGVKCTCTEEHSGTNTGLKWYPNANGGVVPPVNDPGAQINDKLAPLN